MQRRTIKDAAVVIGTIGTVLAIWYLGWRWIDNNVGSPASSDLVLEHAKGLFGDKFGAVNALFSGLAFAGIILTLLLQRRELSLQREELSNQGKEASKRRFEDTFFNLVKLQNEITGQLDTASGHGRDAHKTFYLSIVESDPYFSTFRALQSLDRREAIAIKTPGVTRDAALSKLDVAGQSTISDALAKIPDAFDQFVDENQAMHDQKVKAACDKAWLKHMDSLSPYFNNFHLILKYIDEAKGVNEEEKRGYADILRAQLSGVELASLFYRALATDGSFAKEDSTTRRSLRALLVHYGILRDLPPTYVIHSAHKKLFESKDGATK